MRPYQLTFRIIAPCINFSDSRTTLAEVSSSSSVRVGPDNNQHTDPVDDLELTRILLKPPYNARTFSSEAIFIVWHSPRDDCYVFEIDADSRDLSPFV